MTTVLVISSILLWVLLLFNILLTIGLARRVSRQFSQHDFLKPGQSVPDFMAWTLQDEIVTSADYLTQKVAFIFISPTCQPCREAVAKVQSWSVPAEDMSLVFVSDASITDTKQFVTELKISQPCLVASPDRTTFWSDFKIRSTPSFYLVNAGKVEMAGVGIVELGGKLNLSSGSTKGGEV